MMDTTTTFDTELGRCAVRWTETGISGVLLPLRDGRPAPEHDGATLPDFVRRAIDGMTALPRSVPSGSIHPSFA